MAISHSLNFNLNSCVLLIAFIFVIVEQIREMAKTACALYLAYYNLCRISKSLHVTPAMESGLTDHV
jgi:hypothetical protein